MAVPDDEAPDVGEPVSPGEGLQHGHKVLGAGLVHPVEEQHLGVNLGQVTPDGALGRA